MTYKYSFFAIEQGGAKAGLSLGYTESSDQRALVLRAAARHLGPLVRAGVWSPWTDINFDVHDLNTFYAELRMPAVSRSDGGSSFRTAVSFYSALVQVAAHLRIPVSGLRIAVEGFGRVAALATPLLLEAGVAVVAATTREGGVASPAGLPLAGVANSDTQSSQTRFLAHVPGREISVDELFDVDADVFVPSARVHSIDAQRAQRLRVRAVVPIANVPCTEEALSILDQRGILFLPDYVANGGGVCGHVMRGANPGRRRSWESFYESFGPMVARMLRASRESGRAPRALCDDVAHQGYATLQSSIYERDRRSVRLLRRVAPGMWSRRETNARAARTLRHLDRMFVD